MFIAISGIMMFSTISSADVPISDATSECLECHTAIHPGIVEGWAKSRHAEISPQEVRKYLKNYKMLWLDAPSAIPSGRMPIRTP